MLKKKNSLRMLIIEDELLIAQNISLNLQKMGYETMLSNKNTDNTLELIDQERIDLAIIDIGLSGKKDGITIATEIRSKLEIPIIFLTSHNEEEIMTRATAVGPAAYLLKPYNASQLAASIHIAIKNYSQSNAVTSVKQDNNSDEDQYQISDSIFIRDKNRFVRINYNEVLWLKAKSNYTQITTLDNQYLLTVTLKTLSEKIKSKSLIRIHRSYMINLDFISSFDGNLIFIKDEKFSVSQQYRENFFKRFNIV